MRVSYSDGEELEQHICGLVGQAADRSSLSSFAVAEYSSWPVRYHCCPERGKLLRHFDFSGLDVLELGAGMGAASRVIAESARSFVAVEGTQPRINVLKQRLKDLDNWEAVVSNIDVYETDRRFDVVCLIGVLEYAELYTTPPDGGSPFDWMMKKAESFLKPGGVVIVAIENRNGIKYWAGAPEDHTGQMFDGICGYPMGKTVRTFSRARLLQFFREAGVGSVDEYFPWPDYKTPHAVVSRTMVDRYPELAVDMAVDAIMREPINGVHFFPTTIALYETVPSGLYQEFANSFLFVGGREGSSPTRDRLFRRVQTDRECAWHYSLSRNEPTRTVFCLEDKPSSIPVVKKEALGGRRTGVDGAKEFLWDKVPDAPALLDNKLVHILRRAAYFEGAQAFAEELASFLSWAVDRWGCDDRCMHGVALDAVAQNIVKVGSSYDTFDLEWRAAEPIPKTWFVFRNVWTLSRLLNLAQKREFDTPDDLYVHLCSHLGLTPDLAGDAELEARLQADIWSVVDPVSHQKTILEAFQAPFATMLFPRDASAEASMRLSLSENPEAHPYVQSLKADNQRLNAELSRKCVRIGLALDKHLRRVAPLFSLVRGIYRWGSKGRVS